MRNLKSVEEVAKVDDVRIYENVSQLRNSFIQQLEESMCDDSNSIIEDQNQFDVDSLICDSSTVISEDYKFLTKESNYLHLVLRPSNFKVVNYNYETVFDDDETNTTLDDYLIEIGCKVTSRDKVLMRL